MSEQTLTLQIQGMTCQSCATRIEKVLNKKPFVSDAAVNFAGETAQIRYDSEQTTPEQLMEIIGKAGYRASLPASAQVENTGSLKAHWRLWLLLALSVPFMAGMAGMLAGTHTLMPPIWVQALLAGIAQFWLALPFYRSAVASIRGGLANMDVLVSVGTLSIYLFSLFMILTVGSGDGSAMPPVYFEAGVMVLAFVSLGKYLEERTKRSSLNSLGLLVQLAPRQVLRKDGDGVWQRVKLSDVRIGDTLRCVQGERIAADGTVLSGEGWADESHLTGESRPVAKRSGSSVLAGALMSGSIEYRADKLGADTLLGDMAQALSEAQGSKAPIARIADKAAAVFVPAVGAVAALTFVLTWLAAHNAATALVHAVAVLVVACPCALGLATPAAIMAGMGVAVRHGVWFKNAAALERAGQVDTVVLDKTGTLTRGQPHITAVWLPEGGSEDRLFQAAAAVEQHSAHPLAAAIVAAANGRGLAVPTARQPETEAGSGIRAQIDGIGSVAVGKPGFCGFRLPENLGGAWQIAAVAAVSADGVPLGAFALSDPLKDDSKQAVQRLQAVGIDVRIMSGDTQATVDYITRELGITAAQGGMSPRDKAEAVRRLMAEGRVVAMTGDGINDTPALAQADVGFAVKGSTDAAEQAADATLMRQSVGQLADALLIARATLRNIRQNLFFAFFYNILGIPLAAFGLLTPVLAGAAMAASSVSVLGNALRLKRFRSPRAC